MWSKIMYANTKKLKPRLSGKKLVAAQIWAQIWQNQYFFIMTELQMAIYKVTVGQVFTNVLSLATIRNTGKIISLGMYNFLGLW